MASKPELSEIEQAVFEKYLRGGFTQNLKADVIPSETKPETAATITATDARVTLLPIQTGGAQPPIFYLHVHWIGGAGYSFTLASELGADQPLYVIDPYKFEGLAVPPSIEMLAARYIQTIRSIQPEGPYFLAGFCAGGLLAYEMARQLRAVGQRVDLLALIDPMAGPIPYIRCCGALIRGIGRLLGLDATKQLDLFLRLRYISRILRQAEDENTAHVNQLLQRWRAEHPRRFALLPAAEALRQDWMAVFIWSVSGYRPKRYSGKLTYLFARDNPDRRHLWWGQVKPARQVELCTIPGTHETCRTEHLLEMAHQLRECLRQAQAIVSEEVG